LDFDHLIGREDTASLKWDRFPADVLPFWVADMDLPSPPPVAQALLRRAAHGIYGYTHVPDPLIEAIRDHIRRRHGWRIEAEWFVWLPGLVPALSLVCRAFAAPGEAVMTLTPVYSPFLEAPPAQDRRLIAVPVTYEDGRCSLPLAAMEEAVTPETRVLLFCHPHNPLGRVWRAEEVAAVAEFCRRHDLVLCSDEIHCDLLLDPLVHVPAALATEDAHTLTVTLASPSKTFNMPGLNFAFAIVPDAGLRQRFLQACKGLVPLPGCFAVVAAEAAYRHGDDWLAEVLDHLRGNRDLVEAFVAERLPEVGMAHIEATYLAWLDVSRLGLPDPMQRCLDSGIALSPGSIFGDPGFLRLNFACPRSMLEEGLRRLEAALG
jgi:cystathionine beta-lyase